MDGKPSVNSRTSDKSNDLNEPKRWKRFITIATLAPMLIVKLLIVAFALIFETLREILFCFVPKKRRNIRGQLAVVSQRLHLDLEYD